MHRGMEETLQASTYLSTRSLEFFNILPIPQGSFIYPCTSSRPPTYSSSPLPSHSTTTLTQKSNPLIPNPYAPGGNACPVGAGIPSSPGPGVLVTGGTVGVGVAMPQFPPFPSNAVDSAPTNDPCQPTVACLHQSFPSGTS